MKCICAVVKKILTTTSHRYQVSLSASTLVSSVKPVACARYFSECSINLIHALNGNLKILSTQPFIRTIHGSRELLSKKPSMPMAKKMRQTKQSIMQKNMRDEQRERKKNRREPPSVQNIVPKPLLQKTVEIFEGITIAELSKRTGESISRMQNIALSTGEKVQSEFDTLSIDVAELIIMELGGNVRKSYSFEGAEILPRPPVITVMGHVDHGKTSLLDALRQTSVAAHEAGGITQHIGAFVVRMPHGAAITFLDTPGHAAFSAMRARGAAITDIVVLVVAADDGVMPQTREAMSHAKASDVPMVVAINKCDKPSANPERVKLQLASEGVQLEEMGGDVQVVEISAIMKTGLESLEEALLLQADLMDLKARVDGPAQAYVVEARLDRARGPLATAIVKAGTLVRGDYIVVGMEWGKIRVIRDSAGKMTEKATPAMPVEIEGLKGVPHAGDDVVVVQSDKRAQMLSEGRKEKFRWNRAMKMRDDESREGDMEGEVSGVIELLVLVKADVHGTAEAVTESLKTLDSHQVYVNVFHVGVGPLTQSDVSLAVSCGAACIIGFNIPKPPDSISAPATLAGIPIKQHTLIYRVLEDVGNLIVEKAPGTPEINVAGEAVIEQVFVALSKGKTKHEELKIAGCRMKEGRITRGSKLRLLRSGNVVMEGQCGSLKQEKKDVDHVEKGDECGIVISDCDDYRVGDVVHCLEEVRRKPKFISTEGGAVRIQF